MNVINKSRRRKVIALGDPGHTTVLLSSNFIPLNIGFIASYLKAKFGDEIEIHLFKDPEEIHSFAINNRPDLIALSNYAWNQVLSLHLLKDYKLANPDGIAVMGGPNFPKDESRAHEWLLAHPHIDFVVENEGETSMEALIGRLFEKDFSLIDAKAEPISGSFFVGPERKLEYAPCVMMKDLNDIPSPYLEGWFDQFLLNDIKGFTLLPMIEGSRGCPFACTFCRAGIETNKMRNFATDRVCQEIDYITRFQKANNRPGSVMLITDQNFGIFRRDIEIADQLQRSLESTGYPSKVLLTTGKTNVEVVLETMSHYEGFAMSLAAQSMDKEVLDTIKRKNFPVETFIVYQKTLEEQNKPSRSDIIVALPGETYESHLNTIRSLFKIGISEVDPFTHMMLLGTESEMPEERLKYQYETRWRLLPGSYSTFENERIFESEEVVIATNTMSFDEYVDLRKYHLLFTTVFNGSVFRETSKLIRDHDLDPIEFLSLLDDRLNSLGNEKSEDQSSPSKTIAEFVMKTRGELFMSPEALIEFYSEEKNYSKLKEGQIGENLLQVHRLKFLMRLGQFTGTVLNVLKGYLEAAGHSVGSEELELFNYVQKRADCFEHLITKNNMEMEVALQMDFAFDVKAWLREKGKKLNEFRLPQKTRFELFYPEDLVKEFNGFFKTDRNNITDRARVLYRFGIDRLLPQLVQKKAEDSLLEKISI